MAVPVPAPIDQRFAQLIQQFGLTKNSFAISLGKTASVVQHLIDGRNKPGYDLLCKVFEVYPNVSRDWLLLGRGPMLVGGEPIARPAPRPTPTAELPLEPIDISEIEAQGRRRAAPGIAGSRLQPAEINAALALANAAQQPARPVAPELQWFAHTPQPKETPITAEAPAAPETKAAPAPIFHTPVETPAPTPPPAPAVEPAPAMATAAATPASVAPAPAANPEIYISAALHAQHMQHQLALAEMRNQHLLEQQQMLREMLAMARQAMV